MTKKEILKLWNALQKKKTPALAKDVGDFMLYESLMAGVMESYAAGEIIRPSDIPQLDRASKKFLQTLAKKKTKTASEKLFESYATAYLQLAKTLS